MPLSSGAGRAAIGFLEAAVAGVQEVVLLLRARGEAGALGVAGVLGAGKEQVGRGHAAALADHAPAECNIMGTAAS